jgi:hypothetical protein
VSAPRGRLQAGSAIRDPQEGRHQQGVDVVGVAPELWLLDVAGGRQLVEVLGRCLAGHAQFRLQELDAGPTRVRFSRTF